MEARDGSLESASETLSIRPHFKYTFALHRAQNACTSVTIIIMHDTSIEKSQNCNYMYFKDTIRLSLAFHTIHRMAPALHVAYLRRSNKQTNKQTNKQWWRFDVVPIPVVEHPGRHYYSRCCSRAVAPGFKPVQPEAPSNIQYPIVVSKGNTVTTSWTFKP